MQTDGRLGDLANQWRVRIETLRETATSWIAHGRRDATPVVLKLVKREGDEWHSGEVLEAFDGQGAVRVYAHCVGAVLLEDLTPGNSLADSSLSGEDDFATETIARIIGTMTARYAPEKCPTVEEWASGFDRYLAADNPQMPLPLVQDARDTFRRLAESQRERRLLHGDLQHSNVLFDRMRGWVAIDPKGVVGETAYEIGAMLRNPQERPSLFTDSAAIARRVDRLTTTLHLDRGRVLGWAFAQAILSAVWAWEDGATTEAFAPMIVLAEKLRAMYAGSPP